MVLRRAWAASLAIFVFAASACAGATPPSRGQAPAFRLRDLAGALVDSASLRGKVVVLDFWATWCGPCIAEIPEYAEFWKRNRGRGVEVIGVVVDSGEPRDIAEFVREQGIGYRQLLGDDKVQEAFEINEGLPTTFVIDAKGSIVSRILGSAPGKFESLQKTVDALVKARQP